ncbi:MAG: hypothetical protein AAF219_07225 [Myxococcota bacterium]
MVSDRIERAPALAQNPRPEAATAGALNRPAPVETALIWREGRSIARAHDALFRLARTANNGGDMEEARAWAERHMQNAPLPEVAVEEFNARNSPYATASYFDGEVTVTLK